MEDIQDELNELKTELIKLKEELNKGEGKKEDIDALDKALKQAIEDWRNGKKETETTPTEVKKERKKLEWRKAFTYMLIGSKFIVFASFMYVAMVMYNLDRPAESILLIVASALFLMLSRMEKMGG